MAAQGLAFFGAGTETTSSAISFCAYELCKNPNIQSKLREEIVTTINKHGELTYECLQEMKYLELCILGKICSCSLKHKIRHHRDLSVQI